MKSGESLELQIKRLLEDQISTGALGLDPIYAKVFHKKAYYSKDRGKDIIFDVVIEITRPGAKNPWMIWIWECKDLVGRVPVDDVEEFASKLQQVGVHGVKGTIASRNGFQAGAVEYAKSKKLGLLRLLPDGSTIRLLEAVRRLTDKKVEFGLTHPNSENLTSLSFGLSTSGIGVDSFSDLVEVELANGHS